MLGRDHALSGAAAYVTVAPLLLHADGLHLAIGTAIAAGAGVLPDIDHHDSTISRSFGFLTEAFSWAVGKVSGGHRHGTHSIVGVAVFAAATTCAALWPHPAMHSWRDLPLALLMGLLLAAALRALKAGGHWADLIGLAAAGAACWFKLPAVAALLPAAVAIGCIAHIAGDALTHGGCPLLWPFSLREFHLLPRPLRLTTGKLAEHWLVTPALTAALIIAVIHPTWRMP